MMSRSVSPAALVALATALTFLVSPVAAQDQTDDIEEVSLEDLLNSRVSAAAKYEQTTREAPASVTVITDDEIDRYGYRSLDEVLASVPGIYLNNDLQNAYVGVRGFGRPGDYNNRVLVLINGQAVNEAASGLAFLDSRLGTDLHLVERVEVVRGPGSALYGTGAMLAVINVVTKDAAELSGFHFGATAGSYGYREGELAGAQSFKNGNEIVGALSWGRRDGQDIYFDDLDFEDLNYGVAQKRDWKDYFAMSLRGNVGDFTIQGSHATHRSGDPVSSLRTVFNHEDALYHFEIDRVDGTYENSFDGRRNLLVRAQLNRLIRNTTLPFREGERVTLIDDQARSLFGGGEVRYWWDTSPVNRLVAGAEYRTSDIDYLQWTRDGVRAEADFRYHIASGFLQDEYHLTRNLAVTAGLRYDHYSQAGSALSPRFGIVFNPRRQSSIKLLYGHAFRSPSVIELEWTEPEINFIQNPHLEPEYVRTSEIAWEQQIGRNVATTFSVYHFRMDDLIDLTYDWQNKSIQYKNVGRVNAIGFETGVRYHHPFGILGYANYSRQRARNADSGDHLASSPDHLLKVGTSVPLLDTFYAGTEVRYESGRYTLLRTLTDDYWLVDASLSTRPLFEHLHITLRIKNLLDTQYDLPASLGTRQLSIVQYGRQASLELRFSL